MEILYKFYTFLEIYVYIIFLTNIRGERLCSQRAGGDWLGMRPEIRLRFLEGLSDFKIVALIEPDIPEPEGTSNNVPAPLKLNAEADVEGPLLLY